MRTTPLSFLIALAVFFTALGAHAQGAGHCVNRPIVSFESAPESRVLPRKSRNTVKEPVIAASTIAQARRAELPGRSEMPTMCIEGDEPGCQIERSDAPHHQRLLSLDVDAGEATDFFEGLPTPPEVAHSAGGRYVGGPREGHRRGLVRPPAT